MAAGRAWLAIASLAVGVDLGGCVRDDLDVETVGWPCDRLADCAAGYICASSGLCAAAPDGCRPDCAELACGEDGCGGTCGGCAGDEICDGGVCGPCVPECEPGSCGSDGCGGACACPGDETCVAGLCRACAPACEGRVCGDDGCGGTCGSCAEDERCDAGACVLECPPQCEGRACGDDGCGGTCGTCGADEACADGACVSTCECQSGPCCDGCRLRPATFQCSGLPAKSVLRCAGNYCGANVEAEHWFPYCTGKSAECTDEHLEFQAQWILYYTCPAFSRCEQSDEGVDCVPGAGTLRLLPPEPEPVSCPECAGEVAQVVAFVGLGCSPGEEACEVLTVAADVGVPVDGLAVPVPAGAHEVRVAACRYLDACVTAGEACDVACCATEYAGETCGPAAEVCSCARDAAGAPILESLEVTVPCGASVPVSL